MKAKRTILFFLILSALIPTPLIRADPGWLTGWEHRTKITIDSGDVDTALTDFPILIYLSDSSGINGEDITFVFDEVGANSLKIAVTLSDGTTECYVEVDKWDLGNLEAWLWAKIASISNITDTEIYLYYDVDHADNTDKVGPPNSIPAENVWDANFKFISHMKDDPGTSNIRDSTTNDIDGTKKEDGQPAVTTLGIIDDAQYFDGSDDYVSFPSTIFEADLTGTIEAWFKQDIGGISDSIFYGSDEATNANYIGTRVTLDGKIRIEIRITTGYKFIKDTISTAFDDANWHYVAFVQNGISPLVYVDGILEATTDVIGPSDVTAWFDDIGAILDNVALGVLFASTKYALFDGIIDEVHISDMARSESWIEVTYENGIDGLLDFGPEEKERLESPAYLFGAGFNASAPYVILRWASNLTDINFFEIQNSTDKISWDYLGQSTTNQYTDLQVINGLERFYRIRACNYTEGAWDNSTFTDINFEKVYFVSGGGGLFPGLAIGISLLIIGAIYALEKRR